MREPVCRQQVMDLIAEGKRGDLMPSRQSAVDTECERKERRPRRWRAPQQPGSGRETDHHGCDYEQSNDIATEQDERESKDEEEGAHKRHRVGDER